MKTKSALVEIHQKINRVFYYDDQAARIDAHVPENSIPCATDSAYTLAAYRMPNGSRVVILSDDSEAIWEAYCAECVEKNAALAKRTRALQSA